MISHLYFHFHDYPCGLSMTSPPPVLYNYHIKCYSIKIKTTGKSLTLNIIPAIHKHVLNILLGSLVKTKLERWCIEWFMDSVICIISISPSSNTMNPNFQIPLTYLNACYLSTSWILTISITILLHTLRYIYVAYPSYIYCIRIIFIGMLNY